MSSVCFPRYSFHPLKYASPSRAKRSGTKFSVLSARSDNSENASNRQLNLSVLRFTLGIPGLDESYLPRWIGYGFGSLLLLSHFLSSNSVAEYSAALFRTEALGISLAAFSVTLPYLGKFLKGSTFSEQISLPDGVNQIFILSENVSNNVKDELAWATYILLRNTSTIAVMIQLHDSLCVRGYWSIADKISREDSLDWFKGQIKSNDLTELGDTLYFPQISDSGLWEMLPRGTRSVLVQPVVQSSNISFNENKKVEGFILLASSIRYAYNEKDRAWIQALAKKFRS